MLPRLNKPSLDKSTCPPTSNIKPHNSFQDHRAAGDKQTEAPLTHVTVLRMPAVGVPVHSTETALLHVMNSVYTAASNKEATILVGLNISAVSSVRYHKAGCARTSPGWLADRPQCVKLGKHSLTTAQLLSGLGSRGTIYNSTLKVRGCHPWHSTSALISCHCLSSQGCRQQVHLWHLSRVSVTSIALHSIRVAGRRPHRIIRHLVSPVC